MESYELLYLAPSKEDQSKLRNIVSPRYSQMWGGFHITFGHSMKSSDLPMSADKYVNLLSEYTKNNNWTIVYDHDTHLVSNVYHMLAFNSKSLDTAGQYLIKNGWYNVQFGWHLTLCFIDDIPNHDLPKKILEIVAILKTATWNWVNVKYDKKPLRQVEWYNIAPAYITTSGNNTSSSRSSDLSCRKTENEMVLCDGNNIKYDCYKNEVLKSLSTHNTISCDGNRCVSDTMGGKIADYICHSSNFEKLDTILSGIPEYNQIYHQIIQHGDIRGHFYKLLFTHNTQIPTFIKMLIGDYNQEIRCCHNNRPVGKGAQFTYGLDSMYGEIKIILKPRFWEKIGKGVDWNGQMIKSPFFVDLFSMAQFDFQKDPFIQYLMVSEALNYNFRDIDLKKVKYMQLYEAQLSCESRYIEVNNSYKLGKDPQILAESYSSWCNIQLHLGENIQFSDILAIIVPSFVLEPNKLFIERDNGDRVDISNIFIRTLTERNINGKPNALYDRLIVADIDFENYFNNINYALPKLDNFYNQSAFSNYNFPNHDGMRRAGPNSSPLECTPDAFTSEENIYMKLLLYCGYYRNNYKVTYNNISSLFASSSKLSVPKLPHINPISTSQVNPPISVAPQVNPPISVAPQVNATSAPSPQVKPTKIQVLTYNISWESMTGKPGWGLCPANGPPDLCQLNVANVINNSAPLDLVALQEATNWDKIVALSPELQKMSYAKALTGKAEVISFWNKQKFKENGSKRISSNFNELRREFINSAKINTNLSNNNYGDRPFMILFFDNQKTIFVNAHFSHDDQPELIKLLEYKYFNSYPDYRVIIAADFNTNFNKLLTPYQRKYTVGNTSKNTCCDQTRGQNTHFRPYDHVLADRVTQIDTYIPPVTYPASDHLPLVATVKV